MRTKTSHKRAKGNGQFWNHPLETVIKEVRFYADGIIHTLNHADILPNKNYLMKEAKKNLEGFMKKIQKSGVAHIACDLASQKSSQVLALLNFPTKKDVAKLNARLSTLEKKLKHLSGKRHSA